MNQQQLVSSLGLAGFVVVVVAQPVRADVNKVTAIELKPIANAIEIVLKTTHNKQLQVFISSGKTFVANIVNTQLQLPNNKTFRVDGAAIDSYITLDFLGSIQLGAAEKLGCGGATLEKLGGGMGSPGGDGGRMGEPLC